MLGTAVDLDRTIEVGEDQVKFYQENGYIRIPDVLSPDELEQVRADLSAANEARRTKPVVNNEKPLNRYDAIFEQMVNLWVDSEGMRRITCSRRLAEIARRLTGVARIRLWHDHSLIKMPHTNQPSPWHQDWVYWPMNQTGALSCWLALDDVDEQNGCLSFIPRSYQWGVYPGISLGNPQPLLKMAEPEHPGALKPVSMKMKAGSCTFHDGLTFHYAPGNKTERARRAMAIIYMPDGTTYRKKPHCVTDPLKLADGVRLEGERFPILAEGAPHPTTTFRDARPLLAQAQEREACRLAAAGPAAG